MKKLAILITAIALVCFSVPAMAETTFYGSARMATFWVDQDLGDSVVPPADDDDADLQWDLQGNSRFGMNAKHEAVKGQIEMGINESTVTARRVYGVWNFGAGTLKVGKDYTPVKQFISGQVFDADLGLLGVGTSYGSRRGQIAVGFGGFELAAIFPSTSNPAPDGDLDEWFPKIEAAYGMGMDTWNFKIIGGFQTFEIENATSTITGLRDDFDVNAWTLGADVGVNFGPAYVKGAVTYGMNVGSAAWHIPGLRTSGGVATFDGDDDVDDVDTLMFAGVVGFKVSDMLTLEGGFGWRQDDSDANFTQKDDAWEAYGQAVVALAPSVWIIPEIGYTDFGDALAKSALDDEGSQWYAGAKWQINF